MIRIAGLDTILPLNKRSQKCAIAHNQFQQRKRSIRNNMIPIEIFEEKKDSDGPPLAEREQAFADSVFQAVLGAQLCQTAYLGSKLGWYDELA